MAWTITTVIFMAWTEIASIFESVEGKITWKYIGIACVERESNQSWRYVDVHLLGFKQYDFSLERHGLIFELDFQICFFQEKRKGNMCFDKDFSKKKNIVQNHGWENLIFEHNLYLPIDQIYSLSYFISISDARDSKSQLKNLSLTLQQQIKLQSQTKPGDSNP